MIINHNLNAMNTHRNMGSVTGMQGKTMEKLSSGNRINRASDDAAGLAISEKMRAQIRGLNQASRNAQDGISLIQTAEGALSESHSIAHRMRELAVQSANGIYIDKDRQLIDREFQNLKKEIDRISYETEFNGNKILSGRLSGKKIEPQPGTVDNANTVGIDLSNMFDDEEKLQQELASLGVGTFRIELTQSNRIVKLEIFDTTKDIIGDTNIKKHPMGVGTYNIGMLNATKNKYTFDVAGITIGFDNLNGIGGANDFAAFDFENKLVKTSEDENGLILQIGANKNQTVGINIDYMRSRELGIQMVGIDTVDRAQEAIWKIDEAISKISIQRADLGAKQNRLEHSNSSINNIAENMQAAESRIRDVDMAKEMMNLTKLNVLQQASQAMLSQANQAPEQVLSILK